jgi:hypothetical protein
MRAMNRPPSSRDVWWAEHQRTCGGNYTKIKEPEGYGKSKGKGKNKKKDKRNGSRDIRELFKGKKKGESSDQPSQQESERSGGSFQGQGFVLGTRTGTQGGDDKLPRLESQQEAVASAGECSGAFEGQGFVLGSKKLVEVQGEKSNFKGDSSNPTPREGRTEGDLSNDIRTNMLMAAERRRAQNEGIVSRGRGTKRNSGSHEHPLAKKPRPETGCIVISDSVEDCAKDKTPVVDDITAEVDVDNSIHVIGDSTLDLVVDDSSPVVDDSIHVIRDHTLVVNDSEDSIRVMEDYPLVVDDSTSVVDDSIRVVGDSPLLVDNSTSVVRVVGDSPLLVDSTSVVDVRVVGDDSTSVVEDSQSVQILDLTSPSPEGSPSSPQEWYRNMDDYRTCPVCGMANIPAAIINTHISFCLEAEEEFKLILDDDDL